MDDGERISSFAARRRIKSESLKPFRRGIYSLISVFDPMHHAMQDQGLPQPKLVGFIAFQFRSAMGTRNAKIRLEIARRL
jgi:hypothetical protein